MSLSGKGAPSVPDRPAKSRTAHMAGFWYAGKGRGEEGGSLSLSRGWYQTVAPHMNQAQDCYTSTCASRALA